jgi:NAD+ kinase
MSALRQLGLVIHPSRRIESVLEAIAAWSGRHGAAVGQVPIAGQSREVAEPVDAADCDLVVAVGGDGTALHALRAAAPASRPVLAIACGSVGMLTAVTAAGVDAALEQVAAERFTAHPVPGLDVAAENLHLGVAVNDVAVVRAGTGQILVSIVIDDVLYARVSGDGVVVASALGSSAYSMAAGGPILAPGTAGMVVTPLNPHGGCAPPLVVAETGVVRLEVGLSYGGMRCELDGRPAAMAGQVVTVRQVADFARLVELADQEPRLTALRRRDIVLDAPRALLREHLREE